MEEIWKNIKNYEGLYQVSNLGRIKRLSKEVNYKNNDTRTLKEKVLTPCISKKYYQVVLTKNHKEKTYLLHRLVAEAFIPNPENKPEVNHINANVNDNSVNNLEWNTRLENMQHAVKNNLLNVKKGKKHYMYHKYGKEHRNSKEIIQLTIDNKIIKKWDSLADVERNLNIKASNICKCLKKERETAGNYKWKYIKEMK